MVRRWEGGKGRRSSDVVKKFHPVVQNSSARAREGESAGSVLLLCSVQAKCNGFGGGLVVVAVFPGVAVSGDATTRWVICSTATSLSILATSIIHPATCPGDISTQAYFFFIFPRFRLSRLSRFSRLIRFFGWCCCWCCCSCLLLFPYGRPTPSLPMAQGGSKNRAHTLIQGHFRPGQGFITVSNTLPGIIFGHVSANGKITAPSFATVFSVIRLKQWDQEGFKLSPTVWDSLLVFLECIAQADSGTSCPTYSPYQRASLAGGH